MSFALDFRMLDDEIAAQIDEIERDFEKHYAPHWPHDDTL